MDIWARNVEMYDSEAAEFTRCSIECGLVRVARLLSSAE